MTTATEEQNVIWRPTPKQAEFLSCPAREVLGGGSLGGGKSDSLIIASAAQSGNKHHRALILRRTFPMAVDLIERSHELFLPLGATFNRQRSQFRFPSGAVAEIGFLDADEDKYRYLGRQFSGLFWDELTSWPNPSAYVWMMTRLRATERSGLRLEVRSTCTPGGPGHSWVKSRFNIPDDGSASECVDPDTKLRRVFVPFRLADNVHLRGDEYERSLAGQPESTRKALIEGFWNVFEGAVFSEWNPRIHICEPFPIPLGWSLWRGGDDGYASSAAVEWLAKDEIHDRIYVVAELYKSQMTPEEMAREILRIDKSIPRKIGGPGNPSPQIYPHGESLHGVIDASSFADITGGGGRADVMNRMGANWTPCSKGSGSRLAGISLIHSRLALRADKPGLVVFSTCRALVAQLPALIYSTRNPEDIDDSCEDHAVDALRYGLGWTPPRAGRVRVM